MLDSIFLKYQSILEAVIHWGLAYGYFGAFLIGCADSVILPVLPDPFIVGALVIGLSPWIMVLMIVLGTVVGASMGYFLGKFFGHPLVLKIFGAKTVSKGEKMMNKYGVWAVFIGGMVPIPFKITVWLSGIFEVPFQRFILAAIAGRSVRFVTVAILSQAVANYGESTWKWIFG
ncbi:MAG: VTT domain-containing protein [Patescibacteria group bacterium]|nr:VTT domain-containing protein [Patescibacteria group bacterium]